MEHVQEVIREREANQWVWHELMQPSTWNEKYTGLDFQTSCGAYLAKSSMKDNIKSNSSYQNLIGEFMKLFKNHLQPYNPKNLKSDDLMILTPSGGEILFSSFVNEKKRIVTKPYGPDLCNSTIRCRANDMRRCAHQYMLNPNYIYAGLQGELAIPSWNGFVTKPGFCWLNIIWFIMLQTKVEDFDNLFGLILPQFATVGAFPRFEKLVEHLYDVLQILPYLARAIIPPITVDHIAKVLHVVDQRGIPTLHHQLEIEYVSDLLYSRIYMCVYNSYLVGGDGYTRQNFEKQFEAIAQRLERIDKFGTFHHHESIISRILTSGDRQIVGDAFKQYIATKLAPMFQKQVKDRNGTFAPLRKVVDKFEFNQAINFSTNVWDAKVMSIETFARKPWVASCSNVIPCMNENKQNFNLARIVSNAYAPGGCYGHISIPMVKGFVPKDGFCAISLFLALGQHVLKPDDKAFTQLIYESMDALGSFPTFQEVLRVLMCVLARFPYLMEANIPTIGVNHEKKYIHISDQRGIPQDMHILHFDTPGELILALQHTYENILNYEVGSIEYNVERERAETDLSEHGNLDKFYKMNLIKIQSRWRKWVAEGGLIEDMSKEADLAAFILLSPSTMFKLLKLLENDISLFNTTQNLVTSEINKVHLIHMIRCLIKGVTCKLNDKVVGRLHAQLYTLADNLFTDDVQTRKIVDLIQKHAKLCRTQNEIISRFESDIHMQDASAFFGFADIKEHVWFLWHGRYFGIKSGFLKGRWEEDVRICSLSRTVKRVKHQAKYKFGNALYFAMILVWKYFYWSWYGASLVWGLCSMNRFTIACLRILLNRYVQISSRGQIFFVLMILLNIIIIFWKNRPKKEQELQIGRQPNKSLMSCMAAAILLVHIFDVDVAVSLSNSFNHFSRLSSALIDEHFKLDFGTQTQELQAGILAAELDIDENIEEEQEISQVVTNFSDWEEMMGDKFSRPLEYGQRINQIFKLDRDTVVARAQEAVNTKCKWNFVAGVTGCGKSTYFPVAYYNSLQKESGRAKKILICEPTQASVENIALGIENILGQAITYQHGSKSRTAFNGIQVMTYGSALYKHGAKSTFLDQFDAVFLDESHQISSHSLVFESVCDQFNSLRKFYVTATPRVKSIDLSDVRKFKLTEKHYQNKPDATQWIKNLGSGAEEDPFNYGKSILVFLSGKNECEGSAKIVHNKFHGDVESYGVHSDNFDQMKSQMFNALSSDKRCVIFCTNIFETGVTMDVDVVVDLGYTMRPELDIGSHCLKLMRRRVSRSERIQRIGRCGRIKDGVALTYGDVRIDSSMVDAATAFEAALLSYVFGVSVMVNENLNLDWLRPITKLQAITMSSLQLPIFLTRDLVDKEGRVHEGIKDWVSKRANENMVLLTHKNSVSPSMYQSWPTAYNFLKDMFKGDIPDEYQKEVNNRIPFNCFNVKVNDVNDILSIEKHYKPKVFRSFSSGEIGKRRLVFTIDDQNTHQSLAIIGEEIERAQRIISNLDSFKTRINTGLIAKCLNTSRYVNDVTRSHRIQKRNLSVLLATKGKFEQLLNQSDSTFETDDYDYDVVKATCELQASGDLTREKLIDLLEIEDTPVLTVHGALLKDNMKALLLITFALVSCLFLYAGLYFYEAMNKKKKIESGERGQMIDLEMKNKFDRNKRSEAYFSDPTASYYSDAMTDRIKINRKNVEPKKNRKFANSYINSLKQNKCPFYMFYDVSSDDLVDYAVLLNSRGEEIFRTNTPIKDAKLLREHFEKEWKIHIEKNRATSPWAEDEDLDGLDMEIKLKSGRRIRTYLTPHDPAALNKETAGIAGFQEHYGDLRQTGPTTLLECKATIPSSKIHPGVDNMIAIVSADGKKTGMHAVIYKDWIILPAHLAACYETRAVSMWINNVNHIIDCSQAVLFSGLDLVLVQRPRYVPAVKCATQAVVIDKVMEICMKYRSTQMGRIIQSGSDEAYPCTVNGRWSHRISTYKGLCGAPVLAIENGCFVGIHIMGDEATQRNYFEAFSNSVVDVLEKRIQPIQRVFTSFDAILHGHDPERLKNLQGFLNYFNYFRQDKQLLCREMNRANRKWETLDCLSKRYHSEDLSQSLVTLEALEGNDLLSVVFNTKTKEISNKVRIDQNSLGIFDRSYVYTTERLNNWAKTNLDLDHKEVYEMTGFHGKALLPVIGFSHSHLIDKHVILGKSREWEMFKQLNPDAKDLEQFEGFYAPSRLNSEAYWKDISKYSHPYVANPNHYVMAHALNWVIEHLEHSGMRQANLASTQDVLEDLQWQTASGALYGQPKGDLLEDKTEDELNSLVEWAFEGLVNGENAGVWNGSLKAELRPIEKVEANKTRVFTAAPISTLVAGKVIVDQFNKNFYETHTIANHTVGINKFRRGWEDLYKKLDHPGFYWGGGDGSRFDSSIEPFFFDYIVIIRKYFFLDLDEENRERAHKALEHLYREIVYTPILTVDGKIVVKQLGNNSGQPSTVVDNTLVLMLAFAYAIMRKFGVDRGTQILNDELFRFVCNGDDNKFSVHPSLIENGEFDLSKEFKELGLVYNFDKLSTNPLDQFYMSLRFMSTNYGIGFALEPERIVAIVEWSRSTFYQDRLQSAQAACVEAFNYPDIFMILRKYVIWLQNEYEQELRSEEMQGRGKVCILSVQDITALHYMGYEAIPTQELQMNVNPNVNPPPEDQDGDETPPSSPVNRTKRDGQQLVASTATWDLGTLDQAEIEKVLIPEVDGKKVISPNIMKIIPFNTLQLRNTIAPQTVVREWTAACRRDLQNLAPEHWEKILGAWLLYTAENGTSDKLTLTDRMYIEHSAGKEIEIPIEPFIINARRTGLRKIMRYFSNLTSLILSKRDEMTKWGLARGIPYEMKQYAFDYVVVNHYMPKYVREVIAQAKIAAIGVGNKRMMTTDTKVHGASQSFERHTSTDVNESEHAPLTLGQASLL